MGEAVTRELTVIGAGNMGNAIARLFFTNGWKVVLIDPSDESRARSRERLQDLASGTPGGGLEWSSDVGAARSADFIIEAAPENKALKQAIFSQLESCCAPDTLIATNTSGIAINELAAGLAHPGRFVGAHFFTPADIIPLVEVIAGEHTFAATSDSVMQILREVGKLPVLVRKDIPGFIANRLQHALAREAMSLLEKGVASAEDIDTVAKWSLGIRLSVTGPLEQRDINGLDVHHAIAGYLYADLENRVTPSAILGEKVEQGKLGVKSGQGFYEWNTPERLAELRDKESALRELVTFLEARRSGTH